MKAQVLLPKIFNFSFTYKTKKEKLTPGDIVEVPFGKENAIGVVWPSESFVPRDIKIKTYKNAFNLSWSPVDGAYKYNIYRDDELIEQVDMNEIQLNNLEFGKEYYFKISAIDALGNESDLSIEVKKRTHQRYACLILQRKFYMQIY